MMAMMRILSLLIRKRSRTRGRPMMLRCTRDRNTGLSLPVILLITLLVTLSPYSLPDRHPLTVPV